MLERLVGSFSLSGWLNRVVGQSRMVLLGILIFTGLMAAGIPRLDFSVSVRDLIVDSLPERRQYDEFKALFGSDEIIHVVLKGENIFSPPFFNRLRFLSEAFEQIPGVGRVISLPRIKSAVDPRDQWSLQRFAALTAPVGIFQRYLISPDHRVSGITLVLDDGADQEAVTLAVRAELKNEREHHRAYQIGMPPVCVALARYAQRDFIRLPLCTLAIITILLLAMFRSFLEMALILASVAVAAIWTLGAMAWFGVSLNILTVVVPILQIAVGTAYCLYIYCVFRRQIAVCSDFKAALEDTYSRTTLPTIIAVCTTIAGIASLAVTPIEAVREFSGFACLGVLALLVVVLTFFPCLLSLAWPLLRKRPPDTISLLFSSDRVNRLTRLIVSRRRTLFGLLALLSVFAVAGILRIRVETNPLAYFRDNTAISMQFHDIYRHLSGSFPLHLVLEAGQEDHFLSRPALKALAVNQQFLETVPGVDKTLSLADYLMLVNYVTHQFDPDYYALPDADYEVGMLVNQFKSLLGRDILRRYVSEDFATANITMLTRLSTARAFADAEKRIMEFCRLREKTETTCRVTGFGMVMSLGSRHLVRGQLWSLAITLGVVFALIYAMFLSVRIGMIAMAANLFPMLVSFGAMGWLGIDLSMGTCLVASIVIGLAVDDTIHYLASYKRAYTKQMDAVAAMGATLAQIGRPMVATSLAICAGFSILMLSNFTPTAVFGLLTMLAMVSAPIGGLLILPALLSRVSPITLEEVFQIRIGGNRLQKAVPLLRGMTRLQVHRVLKTGEILQIDVGSHLFDQGDVADRLFVVISGIFDAVMVEFHGGLIKGQACRTRVNRLEPGDVIGEMGIMTSGYRCVSVISVAAGEVLALSQTHLDHLRRVYPRTAGRLYANLSTILTEKLIQADQYLSRSCRLDEDTGLLNREALLECVDREVQRSQRFGEPMAFCLLRIQNHHDGPPSDPLDAERFLCQVARIATISFRKIDRLGRFDSSTLVAVMSRTTEESARVIHRRLKAAFNHRYRLDKKIEASIWCRIMGLDGQVAGSTFDAAGVIQGALTQEHGRLLYPSPVIAATD
ncbi:MMPL family transporter [uncultured Desulfosarcina sp.]|uniref:MMPL family transporter n=1 Tax=uncultured Desulfosarcina sp. TaxID=218289 RepID=UPI0029C802BE|nr:MMPL family transporter [uncultured Desulfosarcina sp.]